MNATSYRLKLLSGGVAQQEDLQGGVVHHRPDRFRDFHKHLRHNQAQLMTEVECFVDTVSYIHSYIHIYTHTCNFVVVEVRLEPSYFKLKIYMIFSLSGF